MTAHVIVVGDLVTDVVAVLSAPLARDSDTPARIRVTGGGQAANTAAWLAWLAGEHGVAEPGGGGHGRVRVTLVASAGADEAGDARVAELRAAGVRCAVSRRPDLATGAIVVLSSAGERTMVTDRGANLALTAAEVDAALQASAPARHLHLSGYTLLDSGSRQAGLRALAAARERGMTTSVDAASAAPLRQVGAAAFGAWVRGTDLLLANADEAAVLASDAPLGDLVRVATVVKRGPAGACWIGADGTSIHEPGLATEAVDPTGAGDAFAAGLLAAWTTGAAPARALRYGARLGALAVRHVGARPRHRGEVGNQAR